MENAGPTLLSVITITYKNDAGLRYTLASIPDNIKDVEHIVVNGDSSSLTEELLVEYKKRRSWLRWISETDKGIYDAMNKGLKMSSGDYVIFMNGGDGFYRKDVLPKLLNQLSSRNFDVIYGKTMFINDKGTELGLRSVITRKRYPTTLNLGHMKDGMMICHQSFIARKDLVPYYPLNNISADYQWMIRVIKNSSIIVNFNATIAAYLVGGESKQRHGESLIGRFVIMKEEFGVTAAIISHVKMTVRFIFGLETT